MNLGCTAASQRGRCRSRAIAKVVRETPRIKASSEPNAATAAPICTTGISQFTPATRMASDNGAAARASRCGPNTAITATATMAYTARVMPSASGMARGIVRAGSRTSSPSVAMRA
ncbi:Uncharacterised protein [Mycobacterium tuberculosis]|uniref:Uncharacterized protein n=1 Tax=Mycobacterium tuberculosis TaxID=1773 RepID=A0A655ACD6_MYCTX|nr:Uncharacterised protein [Mycobacterium tuberculosis]